MLPPGTCQVCEEYALEQLRAHGNDEELLLAAFGWTPDQEMVDGEPRRTLLDRFLDTFRRR